MSGDELAAHCTTLGISTAELAAWEGVSIRSARRWRDGSRPVPGGIATLIRLLASQPWLLASVRRVASDLETASCPQ
jgi:DNA-binding transcriptional regulator YiaG